VIAIFGASLLDLDAASNGNWITSESPQNASPLMRARSARTDEGGELLGSFQRSLVVYHHAYSGFIGCRFLFLYAAVNLKRPGRCPARSISSCSSLSNRQSSGVCSSVPVNLIGQSSVPPRTSDGLARSPAAKHYTFFNWQCARRKHRNEATSRGSLNHVQNVHFAKRDESSAEGAVSRKASISGIEIHAAPNSHGDARTEAD
jgi:hypothetical protein